MARIKHIAIRTPDPDKTAAFYKEVFGLTEVGKARAGVYLSDGYINLAILKSKDDSSDESPRDAAGYAGIDHFGFQIDNLEEMQEKLQQAGATEMAGIALGQGHGGQSYYEHKYRGPDNQVIDITTTGWIGT